MDMERIINFVGIALGVSLFSLLVLRRRASSNDAWRIFITHMIIGTFMIMGGVYFVDMVVYFYKQLF